MRPRYQIPILIALTCPLHDDTADEVHSYTLLARTRTEPQPLLDLVDDPNLIPINIPPLVVPWTVASWRFERLHDVS